MHVHAQKPRAIVSNIKRMPSDRIIALFSLELPSGAILHHCMLTYAAERRAFTVTPPQIPVLTDVGGLTYNNRGDVVFQTAMSFKRNGARQLFESTAFAALRVAAPDLLMRPSRDGR